MNGEGGIGRAEEDLAYLRGDFVTGIDFGQSFDPIGYYPDISLGFLPSLPQAFFELPPVLYGPSTGGEDTGDSATPGAEALPSGVVDPEQGATTTVYESAPGGIYQTNRLPTDWDRVYNEYVILNAPPILPEIGELEMPIDWGEFVGGVIGGLWDPLGIANPVGAAINQLTGGPTTVTGVTSLGQQTAGANVMPVAGCPPVGPKYAKICLATNVITPLRRRRRRRLLTSSDIKDLAALKAIVGGAALQGAVVQAIRR